MKSFLKFVAFLAINWLMLVPNLLVQVCTPQLPLSLPSSVAVESKNGYYLPAFGTIRVLVVLAEINYNIGTDWKFR